MIANGNGPRATTASEPIQTFNVTSPRVTPNPQNPSGCDTPPKVRHVTNHEPSAWLRDKIATRIANLEARGALPNDFATVAPLGRPTGPDTSEDRTCDRCRTYVPRGVDLWLMVLHPVDSVALICGLCDTCYRLEVPA